MGQSFLLSTPANSVATGYYWSNGIITQNYPNIITQSISITPTVSGTYSLSVENSAGCAAPSGTVYVNVYAIPNPTIAATSTSLCIGQGATLTANVTNSVNSYLWNNGFGTQSITVTPTASAFYSVVATNVICTASAGVYVNVYTYPSTPTISAPATFVCSGHSLTLSALTSSAVGSYLWCNGATTQSILIAPAVATTYSLLAQNSINCTAASGTLLINAYPTPNPTISISGFSICAGEAFTFSVASTNTINTFLWFNGATTQSMVAYPPFSDNFTVTVQNSYGCSATASIYADVLPCTGFGTNFIDENISVYPNPNAGTFFIESHAVRGINSYTVFNVLGQPVATGQISGNHTEVNLSHTAKGVYLLKIIGLLGFMSSRRIIVE